MIAALNKVSEKREGWGGDTDLLKGAVIRAAGRPHSSASHPPPTGGVSACSPGTCSSGKTGFEPTEICLSSPPKSCDLRPMPLCLTSNLLSWRGEVYFSLWLQSVVGQLGQELTAGTWRQKQRLWRNIAAGLLSIACLEPATHCLLSLLAYTVQGWHGLQWVGPSHINHTHGPI